jgi:hypothetical protein
MVRPYPRLEVDVRKQGPARPILAPHPLPPNRWSSPQNHAAKANTRPLSADFFSSLLKRARRGHGPNEAGVNPLMQAIAA